jgi:mono/diheme cytochrome c family protein
MMFREISPFSLSAATRLIFQSGAVCGFALLISGCDKGPPAEFKYRESTKDLIDNAQKAVVTTLKDGFGTPNELVAWERFPVAYGGVKGEVVSVGDHKSIVVKIEGEASKVAKGAPLLWVTGSQAGTKTSEVAIVDFNRAGNEVKLASVGDKIAAGDHFIVGFGEDLALGRRVYMKNCMHCHGVTGDGAGPTAEFLNPRPRDYRSGEFKFTSTKASEKVTRDDLHRIVQYGIPGTYMPSFLLLGQREIPAVVEYIRWLSIRGEFEKRLASELTSDYSKTSIADSVKQFNDKVKAEKSGEKLKTIPGATKEAAAEFKKSSQEEFPGLIEETATFLADTWSRAEEPDSLVVPSVPRVEDTPESRERGRLLYLSDNTKCYTCHGNTGRGDGVSTEIFWKNPITNRDFENRGLHDNWGKPLKPRNLLLGQYRGGRRPIDLFRRMYAGIKGTPMPAFGGEKMKDEQLWDLVNYVMSLPYTPRQPATEATPKDHMAQLEEKPSH